MTRGRTVLGCLSLVSCFLASGCEPRPTPNIVKIEKQGSEYTLFVNGSSFYIQGAGVGKDFGKKEENYLRMAKEMGANTVRTWGTDQGTKEYLDEAHRNGLYVVAGIWLNYAEEAGKFSYITDRAYLMAKEKEALDYVKRFRNHPAILMWNIGNEAVYFTKSEDERIALCKFLERLIQEVHAIDPNHPVVYAAATQTTFKYFKEYVPSLDVLGVNVYGSVIMAQAEWEQMDFSIPYLVTEFGPIGPWELPKDVNGKANEQSDYSKAASYKFRWKMIKERRGKNIGGFVFHVGETNQETLTYWNVNDKEFKKEPFLVMQSLFTGNPIANHAPRIRKMTVAPLSKMWGETFHISLEAEDPEGEPLQYFYRASTTHEGILRYYVNREISLSIEGQGADVSATLLNAEPGIYRLYGTAVDPNGNATTSSVTVQLQN